MTNNTIAQPDILTFIKSNSNQVHSLSSLELLICDLTKKVKKCESRAFKPR